MPWGLTWEHLRACIPKLRRPIGAFATHQIRGLHHEGGSQILTISYEQPDGQQLDQTIFLKLTNPGRPEAPKYRYLAEQHARIPHLIGTAATSSGEILILESLTGIGTTPNQADDLLDLIASINTTKNPPPSIFTPSAGDPQYGNRIRQALITLLPSAGQATEWMNAYRHAADRAAQMPQALNHNELSFQQVGWVTESGTSRSHLVVFDLETMSLHPQYTDIAGILPSLAAQTERSEQDLFGTYATAVNRRTGRTTDQNLAWKAMQTVRIVRTFEALPWLITMTGAPEVEAPDHAVTRLGKDLTESDLLARRAR